MQDTDDQVDVSRVCFICLDAAPATMPSGCACRGAAGLAHLGCSVQAADTLVEQKQSTKWRWTCQTCEHAFTGRIHEGLASDWWSKVSEHPEDDLERLDAVGNLAAALFEQGQHEQSETMHREVLAVEQQVLGAENLRSLTTAGNLALYLLRRGRYEEADAIHCEVLAVELRVLGAENPSTLTSTTNLAMSLSCQGKYDEAVAMQREVLAVQQRVLGAEHDNTLTTKGNLAASLSYFAQKGGTRGQRGEGTHGQGREHVKWDMYV
jgi:tetratricopeptide (TPR) repeat protein